VTPSRSRPPTPARRPRTRSPSFEPGGERLVDEIRTRNAPEAKQQLLDRCRDALERLREADSEDAERVESLCDRIRDTDIEDSSVWNDIKEQIEQLD
jgi:hypothetical protein